MFRSKPYARWKITDPSDWMAYPGADFYKVFWNDIKNLFIQAIDTAFI